MKVWGSFFGVAVVLIVAAWWWLGRPVAMPVAPLGPGEKLHCVSYVPFRGEQTPLDLSTHIPASQIEEDLTRLAPLTNCVRTYAVHLGLDHTVPIAQRQGLKVLLGIWLGPDPVFNQRQLEVAIDLANRYPDVVQAIVVGNEVLLRGELSPEALSNIIRKVKAAVKVPVTYADVWEFWLRNRELASVVDFVTVHILPYWEDFPIPASAAADHVASIEHLVAQAFPGKDILVGEFGWPSFGRMRDGALPSPVNQASSMQEVLARAKQDGFRVNLIEAFDQPWKRALEGTVGGHWGLLFGSSREPKFAWGQPVSNHPGWIWQALAGVLLAAAVFGIAWRTGGPPEKVPVQLRVGVLVNAAGPGILIGWAVANAPLESFGVGGWARSLAMLAVALVAPMAATAAVLQRNPVPGFAKILGRSTERPTDFSGLFLGTGLILLTILAIGTALGLVFDPRYKDFPFVPLTAGVIPYAVLTLFAGWPERGSERRAELVAAIMLACSAIYIVINESFANWQAVWLGGVLLILAAVLAPVRGARSS
ncbi:MAG: beta-(1-6) glucans synthase [Xanthobacteraceae bacterium]|nr:beta-(1-6) glucans synthase [Xanthobacteraceae bacterium]